MKEYPDIWLTPGELCRILETYESLGIPIDGRKLYRIAFESAQSRQVTKRGEGRPTEHTNVFAWLIGFEGQNVLQSLITKTRLDKATTLPQAQPKSDPRAPIPAAAKQFVSMVQK